MARFDVFQDKHGSFLLLDLQSDLLDGIKTRVVAPLFPVSDMYWQIGKLNPRFDVGGITYVMATHRMGAIEAQELGPLVTSLSAHADRILAATDFLFQGF